MVIMMPAADVSPLDRQVWNMLTGHFAHLAKGNDLAKRIDPRYGPFAAARDDSEVAQRALADLLIEADDCLYLVEPEIWPSRPGLVVECLGELVQMVAESIVEDDHDENIVELTESDAAEMAELAHETKPGPWGSLTHLYGRYFGIRIDGKLAAMAGERMRPGAPFAEISGVCTAPEFRGRGFARALTKRLMHEQIRQGHTPYLHAFRANEGAVMLYEALGFRTRRAMFVSILKRA